MIKTKNGKVKFKGYTAELLSDVTIIAKGTVEMLTTRGFTKEDAIALVKEFFEISTMSDKELKKKFCENLLDVVTDIVCDTDEEEN